MNFDEITGRLMACLIEAETLGLPQRDVESVHGLIEAGEYGIALDNLCTQLYEFDVPVTSSLGHKLAEVGAAMDLDSSNWTDLEELDPARSLTGEAENADDTARQ